MVRAGVCVGVMESIERPLRRHKDRERLVGVGFPHLDPQHRRSLPPEQPHPRPARAALGQLTDGWVPKRGVDRIDVHVVRVDITPKGDP